MQWIQHHHYLLVANGTQQNFVEVERDFSDLELKMEYLIAHPEEARRIADNNVKTFRERYFAPAAEACYWRALILGWAASSTQPEVFASAPGGAKLPRGMSFENFAYDFPVPRVTDRNPPTNLIAGFLTLKTKWSSGGIWQHILPGSVNGRKVVIAFQLLDDEYVSDQLVIKAAEGRGSVYYRSGTHRSK